MQKILFDAKEVKNLSKILIRVGVVLIGAALILTIYNIVDNMLAEKNAAYALETLKGNMSTDTAVDYLTSDGRPMYEKYPEMEMPTVNIDGDYYTGIIEIPALDIELPVRSEFSYKGLKSAPCVYKGSVYMDNMIIAAHNYSSHFGKIKNLNIGDRVSFTDSDGNVFLYDVSDIVQIDGYDAESMDDGDWDMTLFTCTLDGRSRITIRLSKA